MKLYGFLHFASPNGAARPFSDPRVLHCREVIPMKRLFVGGVLLVSFLLAVNLLSVILVTADENWEMGDLARVATRLGVEPGADGRYDLSSVLSAVLDRLPQVPAGAVQPSGQVCTLEMRVSPAGAGTTTPSVGAWTYTANASVAVSATASPGYEFDHWEGDLAGRGSPQSVVMAADRSITAVFVSTYASPAERSTLTLHAWPQRGGTTTPRTGVSVYDVGATVDVMASPAVGYRFDHWEGDLSGRSNPASLTIDDNADVTAVFRASVEITDRGIQASPGNYVTLHAQTVPGAYCQIEVYLPSEDKSAAKGLDPKWAGQDGSVSWTWRVDRNAAPGIGQIVVSCSCRGDSCEDRVPWAVWKH